MLLPIENNSRNVATGATFRSAAKRRVQQKGVKEVRLNFERRRPPFDHGVSASQNRVHITYYDPPSLVLFSPRFCHVHQPFHYGGPTSPRSWPHTPLRSKQNAREGGVVHPCSGRTRLLSWAPMLRASSIPVPKIVH